MDEGFRKRWLHQRVAMPSRHIHEIAEHIVEFDLQRRDAGLVGIARLKRRDDLAAVIAQAAGLVEGFVPSGRHEAAVTGKCRGSLRQGLAKILCQCGEICVVAQIECSDCLGDLWRQAGRGFGEAAGCLMRGG